MQPKASAARRHRHQRGAALLLAMLILGLVTTITAAMVWQQQRAITVEAAERARAQSSWILLGALDWARLILREDARSTGGRPPVDSLNEPWATPLAEARLSTFLAADKDNNADTGPEAFISGTIVDAQSRFNLRNLVTNDGKPNLPQLEAFRRLAETAGAPTDTADRITAGLAGALLAGQGAGSATAPIRPATVSDLAWLGVDSATLERLRPFVELLPVATPVNANTASREVLVAAIDNLDLGSAERLIQARQREPFQSFDALKAQLPAPAASAADAGRVGVASNWFEVTGRLRLEERVVEERSLLERNPQTQQVTVRRSERRSLDAQTLAGGG
ncbi:MAG: type II secretion system minor pseudopilin GspK [Rubrivivax sp.]